MRAKLAIAGALLASFGLGLSLDVITYDSTTIAAQPGFGSAGIVVRLKEIPYCFGIETAGHPGIFYGGLSECDF
jgi:hypothetical protein